MWVPAELQAMTEHNKGPKQCGGLLSCVSTSVQAGTIRHCTYAGWLTGWVKRKGIPYRAFISSTRGRGAGCLSELAEANRFLLHGAFYNTPSTNAIIRFIMIRDSRLTPRTFTLR